MINRYPQSAIAERDTTLTPEPITGRHHASEGQTGNVYDIINAVKENRHYASEYTLASVYDHVSVSNVFNQGGRGRHRAPMFDQEEELALAPFAEEIVTESVSRNPEKRLWRHAVTALGVLAVSATLALHPWTSNPNTPTASAMPAAAAINPESLGNIDRSPAMLTERLTGIDRVPATQWGVAGTDLGITVELDKGEFLTVGGDTFNQRDPGTGVWRSNVALRSHTIPGPHTPIEFDGALGVDGNGLAPELIPSPHDTSGNGEFSAIPNDLTKVTIDGREAIVASYQSVRNWNKTGATDWENNYSGLAVSYDGGKHFERTSVQWENPDNQDPYQMVSMQRDGDYVYMISDKAGRQEGAMMLRRVAANDILNKDAYQCWDGSKWGGECKPLFSGRFGEPSLRKLSDGTWAMAYLDVNQGAIVTRIADKPNDTWSQEKVQMTAQQLPNLYGGFIHPASTRKNLTLMVSSWVNANPTTGDPGRYDISQFNGRL